MDIRPIFNRELLVATRKPGLWWNRGFFSGMLLAIALATFGARYYWDRGQISDHDIMARVAFQAFLWILLAHMTEVVGVFLGRAAPSIALENDRRTLDFMLATWLSNAEIVLGKLAACMTFLVASFAAGFPIVLLLHLLGGIDPGLILLGYAGMMTTAFFMIALAIWISTDARDARVATSASVLYWMTWLIGPFFVTTVLPRLGLRPPRFLLTANAWMLASSPFGLLFRIAGGVRVGSQLVDAVAWMSGLQIAGGAVLVIWAIARLRSKYRVNVSVDSQTLTARLIRPGWRWRPQPPVGDDPILWREMHTARSGLVAKAIVLVIFLGIYGVLAYFTVYYARPALIEVWRYGYGSGITSAEQPELNLMVRFFMPGTDFNPPADFARTEFNLYLRFITTPLVFLITLVASGMAAELMIRERARETWDSLIATPLNARDILRANMLATLWRMRVLLATLIALWTIGLATGSLHPAGYLVSLLVMAAWTWLMLVYGTSTTIVTKDKAEPGVRFMGVFFLTSGSLALPFLLPRMMGSVLLGAGSPPFVAWLSLVSFRDVRNASHYSVYPALQWMQINTGESPLPVLATCLIGIVIPTLWGLYLWRAALANFDVLIGRPCRTRAVSRESWPGRLASICWMVGVTLSWLRRRDSIG